ncbi:MAG: cell division protein ZipA [Pseudomonadota bacterium]
MSLREWLIIIGALLIIGVVVDGLRRMRRARRDSLEIQRGMGGDGIGQTPIDDDYNSELPNGGARPVGGVQADPRPKPEPAPAPEPAMASDSEPEVASEPEVDPEPRAAPEPSPEPAPDPEPAPEPPVTGPEEPLSASDDDGIVGPARVQGEPGVRARAAEAGEVAGEAASRLSAGARDIWQKIRDGASREEDEGDDKGAGEEVPSTQAGTGEAPEAPPTAGANRPEAEEVIVVHAHCRGDEHYAGTTIRQILEACGMEYGDLGIYHRHEEADTHTPVQFSVASAVSPGTLTPEEIDSLATPGLSFFMSLPGPSEPVQAFDFMLETANTVVRNLGGELRDEHRSVMTSQTIEHCRQRIREFERKRRSPARA